MLRLTPTGSSITLASLDEKSVRQQPILRYPAEPQKTPHVARLRESIHKTVKVVCE